ncbi:PDZ and LIM domain protein 5a isoform X4 [Xiphias gladius]|uniref:PDZ and LIM domain protein 5a isoform X4 n=1 Tax=Xiphias gladius TaxID=8245 RepID=UPI001A97E8BD|nr:PDZ and LIM domain protein 5a isoform X4 [Xiphias gladius]
MSSNYSVTLLGPAPWGFRLQGGKDFNMPLTISRLTDGGKAAKAAIAVGDVVLSIDGIATESMNHLEAQNKIKSCTDNLSLTLQKASSVAKPPPVAPKTAAPPPVTNGPQSILKKPNPPRVPRRHIVDTDIHFYHVPTHADASRKRIMEDTEDWRPRTGTTQSRSFKILAQITGTEHVQDEEADKSKKTNFLSSLTLSSSSCLTDSETNSGKVSERSPAHQSSDQVGVPLTMFSGLNDAEDPLTSAHTDQQQPRVAGSSADRQWPEKDTVIPHDVHISNPESLLKTQNQENNISSTTHLHVVSTPMSYSNNFDMFCQIHPTHLSNGNYPLAPVLVPLTYNGSALIQMSSSHTRHDICTDAQKSNDTSLDAVFLQANTPHSLLGPSPVCTQTPASCLPILSVFPAQRVGVYSPCGSSSVPAQNQALGASSDPVPVHRPSTSDFTLTAPPSIQLLTAERSSLGTPLEGSKDLGKFESINCLTGHDDDNHKLNNPAAESLRAAQTLFHLSPRHSSLVQVSTHLSHISARHHVLSTKPVSEESEEPELNSHESAVVKTMVKGPAATKGHRPHSALITPSFGMKGNGSASVPRGPVPIRPVPQPHPKDEDTLVQMAEHIPAGTRTPMCAHCNLVIRGPFLVAMGKSWHKEEFNCAHCHTSLAEIGFVEEQGCVYCEHCYEEFFAPTCSRCQAKILGEVINALKQTWHVYCFLCACCQQPIRNNTFHLEDGEPYCEQDFYSLFGTGCHGCEFPIEAGDKFLEALGYTWHDTCFVCAVCCTTLEGQTFFSKKDKPLCKKHAQTLKI